MIHQLKKIVSYLPVIGLLLLLCALPFHYGWLQRLSLYIIGISFPIDYIYNQRWKSCKWSNQKWVYVIFICFFLLIPIWQYFDKQTTPTLQIMINNYVPFLFFGICGLLGITDRLRIEYVSMTMLITSVGIIIYTLLSVGFSDFSNFKIWIKHFNDILHQQVNTHMVINLYWNLSVIFGFFIIWYSENSKWLKGVVVALLIPICLALSTTDGRTGLLSFVGVVLIFMLHSMFKHRRWWIFPIMLGFAMCTYGLFKQNNRLVAATTEINPRVYIWDIAVDMIKERPYLGYGVCSARSEFVEKGMEDDNFYNKYAKVLIDKLNSKTQNIDLAIMHPHNALLDTWIQFGIMGVLLLLGCFVLPFTMRIGKYQLPLNLCVFVFAMQSIFESLGSNLQPLYLCLMVLILHNQFLNTEVPKENPTLL